jgi:hypothetical protein
VALSPLWPWRDGATMEALQEGLPPWELTDAAVRSVRLPGGDKVMLPAARRALRQS